MADHDNSAERSSKRAMVPSAKSTEEAVLAFCLRESSTSWWQHVNAVSGMEDSDDLFFSPSHHAVAETMSKILQSGDTISEPLIIDKLNARGYSSMGDDSESPEDFLMTISMNTSISTANELDKSIGILKTLSQRRATISAVEDVVHKLYDQESSMAEIGTKLSDLSLGAMSAATRRLPSFKNLFDEVMYGDSATYTVPTGLPSLDYALGGGSSIDKDENIVGGWGSGRTYVIAAGSGVGKTTAMFRFAREAIDNDVIPIIFSLESSGADILAKFISGDSNAKFKQVMASCERKDPEFRAVDEQDREAVLESAEKFNSGQIKILSEDDMLNGIHDIPASVMSVRDEVGDPNAKIVIFIDYLQLLIQNDMYERQELSGMTRELHNIAQSMDVPIVMLSQFSQLEKGVRPQKRDLYGSSAIEKNADGVLLMWRPGDLENQEDADVDDEFADAYANKNIMMIDLAKNRVGEQVVIRSIIEHSRCIVEELSDEDMDSYLSSVSHVSNDDDDTPRRSDAQKSRRARREPINGGGVDDDVDTTPSLSRRARSGAGDQKKASSRRKKRRSADTLDGIGV